MDSIQNKQQNTPLLNNITSDTIFPPCCSEEVKLKLDSELSLILYKL